MVERNNKIQLFLSRSTYPIKSSVIGCVNVSSDLDLSSLKIYVAGRARLDSRWFDIAATKQHYGTHPCLRSLPSWVEKVAEDGCFNGNDRTNGKKTASTNESICFWSTNVLSLYENDIIIVPHVDNSNGEAEDDKPNPLEMSGSEWFNRASQYLEHLQGNVNQEASLEQYESESESSESDSNSESNSGSESEEDAHDESSPGSHENKVRDGENEENEHSHSQEDTSATRQDYNFTFRSDLPDNILPTLNAVCVRYYYSVVVFAKDKSGKTIVVQAPFTVVAPTKRACALKDSGFIKPKISIGYIHALSHARPYLAPLSATYKAEPISISVKRSQCWDMSTQKSIPIEENGNKCGTLTIIGGGLMAPGENISLQYSAVDKTEGTKVLSCYQVSACLQGEEYAIGIKGAKKRSKTYVFDTDFEKVYPGATQSVSLSLNLPVCSPITISTDFVEINITCRIDFTVRSPGSKSFRFLTVEFPCRVVPAAPEEEEMENGLSRKVENKILDLKWSTEQYAEHRKIITSEVLNDLSMLSLHMLNKMNGA